MRQAYLALGAIIVLAIVGVIFANSYLKIADGDGADIMIVELPSVDVEATVTSLYLDDLSEDCEEPEVCPRDRATLRIDDIDRTNDPNSDVKLNVGDEVEVHFKYSARPAKLRRDIPPTCPSGWILKSGSCVSEECEGPECMVSSPNHEEKPAEMEGSYIVYHLPDRGYGAPETILPGVGENSKIKIRGVRGVSFRASRGVRGVVSFSVGEYEIISFNIQKTQTVGEFYPGTGCRADTDCKYITYQTSEGSKNSICANPTEFSEFWDVSVTVDETVQCFCDEQEGTGGAPLYVCAPK